MARGAKILAFAAALCLILWVVVLAFGAQPLRETDALQVIYGEGEDFFSDAVIYRKVRSDAFALFLLPRARPAYRWWMVDFRNMSITVISSPRSLGSRKYLLRGEPRGTTLDNKARMGDWYWHFTESGAAFSGNGFTCSVRKNKGN
jgi:hypothetical protein